MNKLLIILKKIIPTKLFHALQPAYHFLLSAVAAFIYRNPSEKLLVIGITGTAGKTSSTYILAKALNSAGLLTGYTSTAMFGDGKKEWLNDKKMTMAGRFFIQKMLSRMVVNGCKVAIVETTSEGIRQFRHRFINFDLVCFTSLYPEHIESHGSFENYKKAKGELFAHLHNCKAKYTDEKMNVHYRASGLKKSDLRKIKKTIIVNQDDEHASYFLDFRAEKKIGYTKDLKSSNNVELIHYSVESVRADGTDINIEGQHLKLRLLGEFNAENSMISAAVFKALELPMEKLIFALESIDGIPGRFEAVNEGQDFAVIVDYAYEPVAMEKLYEVLNLMPHQKIIHVLGSAGGGRDASRRPLLGRIAGEKADYVIVTNEDPYDEDPQIIMDQVTIGAEKAGKKINENLFNILDRRDAIKKALNLAKSADIVLVTGKGSEQAICVKNSGKIAWDDRKVLREEIKRLLENK